jgi:superfamily II DNA/RNA helicase
VGRTARAGRAGKTFSLARTEEMRHFKEILSKAENSKQTPIPPNTEQINKWMDKYKVVLL